MRKVILLSGFLALLMSSCAIHRNKIVHNDHHMRYWHRHHGGWWR
ncbi:MAG TPA: hypothetical protein VN721_17330 [Flavipsychrobacter sp.]|nr:hypothetical protein [Flavipsychrobacter sp.]